MPDFEDFGGEISKIWPKKLFRTAQAGESGLTDKTLCISAKIGAIDEVN
jgi:hypothetical protein